MKLTVFVCSLLISVYGVAQFACGHANATFMVQQGPSINNNGKSDTVDILHYHLDLNLYNIASGNLQGNAAISLKARQNGVTALSLDLLKLSVDSIVQNGTALSFQHNDTIIRVQLNAALNTGDSTQLTVYYQGTPPVDASGWGGFHRQNGYYFNLGVGFASDPHTFGRAWFPCFDNFVEHSTYSFSVITKTPNRAFCNGLEQSYTITGDTAVSEFNLNQEIPTYLASVAVSNYQLLEDTLQTSGNVIPIWLMAKAGDTANMKQSFRNLKPVTRSFIHHYGPYYWDKIGYATTTIGAMEHATSIHYPVSTVNGSLANEDLLAHELAHHWWGNLITCKTDADMWINEGMAEFSSHLYTEQVYGKERYFDIVAANAASVLKIAHTRDNGYKSIYGLDHEYTYGYHVYQKGAMVGHNLRAYLGYKNFDSIINQLMADNKYSNLSTVELKAELERLSGQNLDDFFNQWVLAPGFPQFGVADFNTDSVSVSQSLYEASSLYNNVPVSVTYFDANGDTASAIYNTSGATQTFSRGALPFTPQFALTAYNGKLLSATTTEELVRKNNGLKNLGDVDLRFDFDNMSDSIWIIAQKHWAKPSNTSSYRVSNDRYWTLQGYNFDKGDVTVRFTYNARAILADDDLVQNTEDSIALFYRPNGAAPWQPYANQVKTNVNPNDGVGYIEAEQAIPGEYVLANATPNISLRESSKSAFTFEVYPNPGKDKVYVVLPKESNFPVVLKVTNAKGDELRTINLEDEKTELNFADTAAQTLFFTIEESTQAVLIQ